MLEVPHGFSSVPPANHWEPLEDQHFCGVGFKARSAVGLAACPGDCQWPARAAEQRSVPHSCCRVRFWEGSWDKLLNIVTTASSKTLFKGCRHPWTWARSFSFFADQIYRGRTRLLPCQYRARVQCGRSSLAVGSHPPSSVFLKFLWP